jgi:hypothetical protein
MALLLVNSLVFPSDFSHFVSAFHLILILHVA